MHPLLKKLNFRDGDVVVVDAPEEVEPVLRQWEAEGAAVCRRLPRKAAPFVLAFVRSCADIDRRAASVAGAVEGDGVLWMAYPKKSSKRYRSDVGRDDSWQALGDLGFEPVRQVAVDDDWSALRFRRTEHIAAMTRSRALSQAGRRRIAPGVEAVFAAARDDRRPALEAVHDTVTRAAPALTPERVDDAVGYGRFRYRYASGREGESFVVMLANQKRHVSVYVNAATEGRYLAEAYASRLGRVSVGKSCIRFRKLEDLDLDALAELEAAAARAGGAGQVGTGGRGAGERAARRSTISASPRTTVP